MVNEGQMIVISLVNSKGGVGKTTAALLLATGLSEAATRHQQPLRAHITVLDADPNQPIQEWADTAGPSVLANMTVRGGVNENNIAEIINGLASEEEETTGRGQIVIVDTQGAGNVASSYAIMASDLVLVPVQASLLDGREAAKTIDLVAEMSEKRGSQIPCYAVWQRANAAIETRSAKNLREQFARLGATFLATKL